MFRGNAIIIVMFFAFFRTKELFEVSTGASYVPVTDRGMTVSRLASRVLKIGRKARYEPGMGKHQSEWEPK